MKKRLLVAALTLCMTVTMMPAFAFASSANDSRTPAAPAEPIGPASITLKEFSNKKTPASETGIAEVNGTKYTSVQDALNNASVGDTVKLLADTNESIIIAKGLTLDLNGFTLYTDVFHDTITVDYGINDYGPGNHTVTIKNGDVINAKQKPSELTTAIYVIGSIVTLSDVTATVAGSGIDDYQGAVIYVENSTTTMKDCEIYYDTTLTTENDYIDGLYVDIGAAAVLEDCSIETLGGDCAYVNGSADFENCYMAADGEYFSAVHLGTEANKVKIYSGYYYGDTPLYTDTAKAVCKIYEGEFCSSYDKIPVVGGNVNGYANAFAKATVSGKNIISTPLNNWKSADNALIFNGAAAPATVKANLTAVNGQKAGYDDIKVTWTAAKNSGADGYRVNYKKGTGAYVNGKFYKGSGSRTVANLADGYKYTFNVTPYIIINDDILSTGTKCFSNKTKTAYTYTLKKVVLNNFAKSNGKVKVAWKNINGETGYQISRAAKKTGTNIIATVATTTGTSKLISATKGKTYWYKVRAYKTVDGKKIFGPWSAPKSYKR